MAELSMAWTEACEPFLYDDITSATWEQVSAFPTLDREDRQQQM